MKPPVYTRAYGVFIAIALAVTIAITSTALFCPLRLPVLVCVAMYFVALAIGVVGVLGHYYVWKTSLIKKILRDIRINGDVIVFPEYIDRIEYGRVRIKFSRHTISIDFSKIKDVGRNVHLNEYYEPYMIVFKRMKILGSRKLGLGQYEYYIRAPCLRVGKSRLIFYMILLKDYKIRPAVENINIYGEGDNVFVKASRVDTTIKFNVYYEKKKSRSFEIRVFYGVPPEFPQYRVICRYDKGGVYTCNWSINELSEPAILVHQHGLEAMSRINIEELPLRNKLEEEDLVILGYRGTRIYYMIIMGDKIVYSKSSDLVFIEELGSPK